MNDKCKYCNYLSKCHEKVEFNSVMCHINRSFPKMVDKSYEEILKENKDLKEKNEFLMKRDNKCQLLEQVIKKIKDYLEYYLIDNLKYEESQKEFKRLLDILKEVE